MFHVKHFGGYPICVICNTIGYKHYGNRLRTNYFNSIFVNFDLIVWLQLDTILGV